MIIFESNYNNFLIINYNFQSLTNFFISHRILFGSTVLNIQDKNRIMSFCLQKHSESMVSCLPGKIQYKNALKIRRFFYLLVFKRFKLFFNVRKVRKNQKHHAVTKNSNNKCFSCNFWEYKKKYKCFQGENFLLPPPPGQNGPFFLGAGSMDSLHLYSSRNLENLVKISEMF